MPLIAWIILFCLLGGLLSVLAAALFLILSESLRNRLLPHLVSFATGTLLGAAFLGLLPHALEAVADTDIHVIPMAVLFGLLGFFVLEKLVLWRHCHVDHCEVHAPGQAQKDHSTGTMILIGDGVHNFLDGILIAGAFLTDIHLGVVTSLAVAAHEIPQEVGNFAILLHSGYARGRAFFYNVLSSLTTVVGGLLAYLTLQEMQAALPYVLAVAASSFIYIAVADLIPTLHQRVEGSATVQQVVLITAGILVIYSTHSTLH
ncbi:MAG: ZIP family metal transporter [Gammaproteobacteria bacterium]|nr:MAG: ZIP family metal transporter [Gammaproteobacteria bacterium]